MVPHLTTALIGPLGELEQRLLDATPAIERWFRLEWMEHTPPLYAAVHVRHAGFKLAPVATDLFPGGWHLLSPQVLPLAVQAAQAAIEKICPEARRLLIVPPNGPLCGFYLASLQRLSDIFRMAGLDVRLGSIDPALKAGQSLAVPGGGTLRLEPVQRTRHRLGLKGFDPCTILLNNDLATGAPGILEDLHEQYLLPPLQAGLGLRRKSRHFQCHEEVSKRFGKLIGADPWLMHPLTLACEDAAREPLRAQVQALLNKLQRKYKEYGIAEKPFAVIRADQGRGGQGLLAVRGLKDLDAPAVQQLRGPLIVQEGVLTHERLHDAVAEPVVHLIDRYVVGGYYRVRAPQGSASGPGGAGAHFVPLAFAGSTVMPRLGDAASASAPNRFYLYGVMARLALVAAAYELEVSAPEDSKF